MACLNLFNMFLAVQHGTICSYFLHSKSTYICTYDLQGSYCPALILLGLSDPCRWARYVAPKRRQATANQRCVQPLHTHTHTHTKAKTS